MNARAGAHDELGRRVSEIVLDVTTDPLGADGAVDLDGVLAKLDSVTTVDLLVRLETEFGIAIPASAVVRENFASLSALRDLVRSGIEQRPSEAR